MSVLYYRMLRMTFLPGIQLIIKLLVVLVIVIAVALGSDSEGLESSNGEFSLQNEPTVFIAIFVRNKAHTLPYFLTLLEGLDYPKDRISLW